MQRLPGNDQSPSIDDRRRDGSRHSDVLNLRTRSSVESKLKNADTEELVRLAQTGEDPALDTLFGRYRSNLVDLARRGMGHRLSLREDPEDLAQTTFREAARDFPGYEYRGKHSFMGWLNRILQNKLRDRAEYHSAAKRDASREIPLTWGSSNDGDEAQVFDPASSGLTGLELAELAEEIELLHEHLELLTPVHREAIRLVYYEGLSLRQAGQKLNGRTEGATRMLIRRAAANLKDSLPNELKPE
ncbi:MAG: RNA polymerase sigma factor (sigma-70 family) [Planctomycetota bacterium]|jgi:RNA polymerase sigma factor (sigma-70 family)